VRRPLSLWWAIASFTLILAGFGLWIAGRGELVLAVGIALSCGGAIIRWAFERD
jgi:hypothetical protein